MSNYSDSTFTEHGKNTSWYKVLSVIPDNAYVLDIGCSSGNFGQELIARKNCKVDGIELDRGDYSEAKKKLGKVHNLNIETDSISHINDKYDVIYFGDVVEHLVNPVDALKKVKTLLGKDGVIVFSIPNMAHITIRLLMLKGDFEYTETGLLDKTHLHFYNLDEVQRVFNSAGYEISKLDYVEKDYPDKLIIDELKKHGLELSKKSKFLENARKVDAAAFQFVGIAKPVRKNMKIRKLKQFGPIDMFESYHENTLKALKDQNEALSQDAQKWQELKKSPTKFVVRNIKKRIKL